MRWTTPSLSSNSTQSDTDSKRGLKAMAVLLRRSSTGGGVSTTFTPRGPNRARGRRLVLDARATPTDTPTSRPMAISGPIMGPRCAGDEQLPLAALREVAEVALEVVTPAFEHPAPRDPE